MKNKHSIDDLDISTDMPEYDEKISYLEYIEMFRNMLDEQQANINLMKRYLRIIEYRLNK